MTEYSTGAQRLMELLSDDEIQQIKKDNPFRIERNAKIHELCRRGVSQVVLAEVSGLSGTSISRICIEMELEKRADNAERGSYGFCAYHNTGRNCAQGGQFCVSTTPAC